MTELVDRVTGEWVALAMKALVAARVVQQSVASVVNSKISKNSYQQLRQLSQLTLKSPHEAGYKDVVSHDRWTLHS